MVGNMAKEIIARRKKPVISNQLDIGYKAKSQTYSFQVRL